MKKVIKISNSRFVHKITSMNVVACDHVKDAMDISEIPLDVLKDVVKRLRDLGYSETKITEVKK